ncbi:ryanodine-inositol 1,4,5-triphosphate receptor Ca2 channel (RIR-CaC) family protein [Phytophthora cinnamomi]|uniref:ryanodine-inositol 1,4,5-triphosphate receptor Ca2 channel (RIR-CaC) family protein n=1 Tax=Phytophthora cinnamomi TaxID=4785 RepID=UPI00355AB466|nr:ryanodine-inositol 1,4,5-triphosphate receptor Ca2 channel (RIR-CaC) family protein [Phytophthora cinnamomi]
MNLVEVYMHFLLTHGTYAGNSECSKDFYLAMGFNIYILLQQLADQYPEQAWWIPASGSEEVLGTQTWQTPQSSRSKSKCAKEKVLDMRGRCFICSIDAYTFDRATKRGFHDHVSRDHNMWHYLYLFVHIRKKNITEYNGLELFLAMRMAKKDVSFFPTHRALSLTKRGDLDESHEAASSIEDGPF